MHNAALALPVVILRAHFGSTKTKIGMTFCHFDAAHTHFLSVCFWTALWCHFHRKGQAALQPGPCTVFQLTVVWQCCPKGWGKAASSPIFFALCFFIAPWKCQIPVRERYSNHEKCLYNIFLEKVSGHPDHFYWKVVDFSTAEWDLVLRARSLQSCNNVCLFLLYTYIK